MKFVGVDFCKRMVTAGRPDLALNVQVMQLEEDQQARLQFFVLRPCIPDAQSRV